MSTILKLNLDEVRSLLGLSTDSILNHIDKGTLRAGKVRNKGEEIYIFEFAEVKDFAKEFLDMAIDMPVNKKKELMEDDEYADSDSETDERPVKSKKSEEKGTVKDAVTDILSNLQRSYETALRQLSDYKEQAAFRIGQLEGELSSQKKLLASGQQEMSEKERLIKKLKIELKATRDNLESEKNRISNMSLFERIFFKKQ